MLADNIANLIEKSMKKWKVELASEGEALGKGKIDGGILEGDNLPPIVFVIATPLSSFVK